MPTKTISIRISEEQAEFLTKEFKSISNGVNEALSALQYIRIYSLNELKGKFSKPEWVFFVDSLNGTLIEGMMRCNASVLVAHCEDSEALEGTASKHGVDLPKLISKIEILTGAQIESLYARVEGFWNDPERDLNIFSEF